MATYYVATTGGGSGHSGLIGDPWSASWAETHVAAGDTVFFRGGTYDFYFSANTQGTSDSNRIRFAAYHGETVGIKPTSGEHVIHYQQTQCYVEFDGLNLDATDPGTVYGAPVTIEGSPGINAHHIRIKNAEIICGSDGIPDQGTDGGPIGIICSAATVGIQGWNEFIDLVLHGGGDSGDFSYSFYIQSSNNTITRCEMYDTSGAGVHFYCASIEVAGPPSNNTVDSCFIHDITRSNDVRVWGVIVWHGVNNLIKNCRIARLGLSGYDNAGIFVRYSGTKVYNNSVYDCTRFGIYVDANSTNADIRNNIAYQNAAGNYLDGGSGTFPAPPSHGSNIFNGTNPLWVDPNNDDYHLQAGSPAIGVGDNVGDVTTDADGNPRVDGSYDIGPYAYSTVAPVTGITLNLTAKTSATLWTVNTSGVFSVHPSDTGAIRYWDDPDTGYAAISPGGLFIPHWRAGLMLKPSIDFDGTDQFVIRNDADSSTPSAAAFVTATALTMLVAFRVRSVTGTDAVPYLNEYLIADTSLNLGVFLRNNGGAYTVQAYNFDGSADVIELPIALNTSYVLMMRHQSGTLYASLNGGTESSVASGNTDVLTSSLAVGYNDYVGKGFDGQIGAIIVRSDALTGAPLASAIATLMADWITGNDDVRLQLPAFTASLVTGGMVGAVTR